MGTDGTAEGMSMGQVGSGTSPARLGRLPRMRYLVSRAWAYLLAALDHPRQLPALCSGALTGVHIGEFLKLDRPWLRRTEIKTVIDIGAHQGEFASAARAVLPGIRLYAFEPLEDCYERLRTRFERYGSFDAFQVALGAERSSVTFHRSSFSESSSVLPMDPLHRTAFPWSARTTPVTVQVERLDDYIERMDLTPKVLVKIDVQGYEDRVLRGGGRLLKRTDYVLVEVCFQAQYDCQARFHEVYDLLSQAGLSYAGNLEQLYSPLDGTILQADALFIRAS